MFHLTCFISFDLPTIYITFKLDLKGWQNQKSEFDTNFSIESFIVKN